MYPDYPPVYPVDVGDAKYVERLAESLCDRGVNVSVVTSWTEVHRATYSPRPNLTIFPAIHDWSVMGLKDNYFRLRELFQQIQPDAINIIYPAPSITDRYVLPYFLKIVARRTPTIATLFHFFPKNSNVLYKCMAPLLYFGSTKIHFHDDCLMTIFKQVLPLLRRRTLFIPVGNLVPLNGHTDGISKEKRKSLIGLDQGIQYIAFVGYWYPGKGVDLLLEALRKLKEQGRQVRLLLVGGRSRKDMRDYEIRVLEAIDHLHLREEVVVTGHCSDEEMISYLLCSEMAVFPFKNNKMVVGRSSIMLPMVLGLPIILTRPARPSKLLLDRENVVMVPPNDVKALAAGIAAVLDDGNLRRTLRENAADFAAKTSWDSIAQQWLKVLGEIRRL